MTEAISPSLWSDAKRQGKDSITLAASFIHYFLSTWNHYHCQYLMFPLSHQELTKNQTDCIHNLLTDWLHYRVAIVFHKLAHICTNTYTYLYYIAKNIAKCKYFANHTPYCTFNYCSCLSAFVLYFYSHIFIEFLFDRYCLFYFTYIILLSHCWGEPAINRVIVLCLCTCVSCAYDTYIWLPSALQTARGYKLLLGWATLQLDPFNYENISACFVHWKNSRSQRCCSS